MRRAKAVVEVVVELIADCPRPAQRFSIGEDVAHRDPFCAIDAFNAFAKLAASASIFTCNKSIISKNLIGVGNLVVVERS